MKRVFIIHSWGESSNSDWLPWLGTELERRGFQVFIPDMPNTDAPDKGMWVACLEKIVGTPDADTFFVGHSIGCQTILRYLQNIKTPIGGALFVAGWFNLENLEDSDARAIARPWIETPIDVEKVKQVLSRSVLLISDDDPYGAFEENKNNFAELGAEIVVLSSAGHITADDGYAEIPEALEQFEKLIR